MERLLTELGVQRLAFACLTHPHQDHYGGLGKTMASFGPVEVALFPSISSRSVEAELAVEPKRSRRLPVSGPPDGLKRAFAERELAADRIGLVARMTHALGEVTITVLAPTEPASASAAREAARGTSRGDPNEMSAALMLRWGQAGVLLAGDLIATASEPTWGWNDARKLIQPCQVAKVSHHASHNGHDDDVWAKMAAQLAIVTPFKEAQASYPPCSSDLDRLLKLGVEVAVTSPPHWWSDPGPLVQEPAEPPASPLNRDCAVAVQLDQAGRICKVVLGGRAALYQTREMQSMEPDESVDAPTVPPQPVAPAPSVDRT